MVKLKFRNIKGFALNLMTNHIWNKNKNSVRKAHWLVHLQYPKRESYKS